MPTQAASQSIAEKMLRFIRFGIEADVPGVTLDWLSVVYDEQKNCVELNITKGTSPRQGISLYAWLGNEQNYWSLRLPAWLYSKVDGPSKSRYLGPTQDSEFHEFGLTDLDLKEVEQFLIRATQEYAK
jgi:hypothetical protein